MCGIAGILEFARDKRAEPAALRAMCQIMAHRGPDDDGFYSDGPAAILAPTAQTVSTNDAGNTRMSVVMKTSLL